jgi:hypothetical protein
MSSTPLLALVARCRALCRPRSHAPDAELLSRFAQERDAAAAAATWSLLGRGGGTAPTAVASCAIC